MYKFSLSQIQKLTQINITIKQSYLNILFQLEFRLTISTKSQPMQNQKNMLDSYKSENIPDILFRTLSCEKHSKTINPTQQRQLYSQLLDYSSAELNKNILQFKKQTEKDILSQRQFVSLLVNEVVKLAQRQCIQKSSLLSLLFTYYQESLISTDLFCQRKIANLIKEYCNNIEKQKNQYQEKLAEKQSKLAAIQKMNDQKWKTFYIVVKDNRVLRRQKGKLMRLLTEERNRLAKVHQQMIEIAKQNEKNKLLATYVEQSMSLELYIKNYNSISKLQQFMRCYPKYAKKILRMDLQKLQVIQNTRIDEKIEYILKSVKEQQEIFDEYEDLTDVVDKQPNKLIFNISTQTCPEDCTQATQFIKKRCSIQHASKIGINHRSTQTTSFGRIKLQSNVIKIEDGYKQIPPNSRRRKALKIHTFEDEKMMETVKTYIDNHQIKRVIDMKFIEQSDKRSRSTLVRNVISMAINFSMLYDFPKLPTNYRLKNDMKRGKQISRRDFSSKKLSKFLSNNIINMDKVQGRGSKRLLTELQQPEILEEQQSSKSVKNMKTKYIVNSSETKTEIQKQSKEIENDFTNLTNQTITIQQNKEEEFAQPMTEKRFIKNLTKRRKESLKQLMKKNKRISILIEKQNTQIPEIKQNDKPEPLKLNIQEDKSKSARKSGFIIYRNSKSKVVTQPDEDNIKEEQEDEISFNNLIALQKKIPNKMTKIGNSSMNKRMSHQVQRISQFSRASVDKQQKVIDRKDLNTLNTGSKEKEHTKRVGTQQKIINTMSPQFLRLADKIVKSIYTRRREIFQGKLTFQSFLKSFMITQYGSQLQIILVARFTKTINNAILQVFDLLLNSHQSKFYLQHIFRLFAKIIVLNGGDGLEVCEERGRQIYKQIIKVYTREQLVDEEVKHFYRFGYEGNFSSLANNFISIQKYLRQQLNQSELYNFLQILLPRSQTILNYEEIREIFGLFQFEPNYHEHLFTVKQLAQSQMSIYNLCFLANRQQWSPFLHIKSYIISHYQKLFGQFDQQTNLEYIAQNKALKFDWSVKLVDQNLKYGLYAKTEDKILLIKYISLLLMIHYVEKQLPLSQNLSILSKQYSIVTIKKKADPFQF